MQAQPSRPTEARQELANRFHFVSTGPLDFVHQEELDGFVYITHDGERAILWSDQADKHAQVALYLTQPVAGLLKQKVRRYFKPDAIGAIGGLINQADRKQLLSDFYGKQKAKAILANKLG